MAVGQRLAVAEDAQPQDALTVWTPVEARIAEFRGLHELTLDLTEPVTVLVGPNGAGKTSALEALELLHTGAVLDERGKTVKQDEYLPESGNAPEVSARYLDLTGARQGPNEDLTHSARRTLKPHKVGVNRWDGGAKDASLQLYRAMEWDIDRLPTLMQADRFPRLTQSEQAEFLADWVRGGERGVNLVAQAGDDLQRSIAEEIAKRVEGFGGNDAFESALVLLGERRTAADKDAKQAKTELAAAQGALEEALTEVREAGYEGGPAEIEAEVGEASVDTGAALAQARDDLQIRQEVEASVARWQDASQQAQADLAAAQEELAGADAQAAEVAAKRAEAEAAVALCEEEYREADLGFQNRDDDLGERAERIRRLRDQLAWDRKQANSERARLEELRGEEQCPTCNQATERAVWERMADEASGRAAALEDKLASADVAYLDWQAYAERALDPLSDVQTTAGAALGAARRTLASIPLRPDADAIRARIANLQERIDTLAEQQETARETLAAYPDDLAERVQTLQDALSQHRATGETLKRAGDWQERAGNLAEEVQAHEAERLACTRLKSTWQDAQATQMTGNPHLEALLAEVTAILTPVRGWQAGWSGDGPVVIGPGFTRELGSLSDGERLTVGAAWQAAMARRVGLGLCMIDRAAEIDTAKFIAFAEACVAISEVSGVRFLIARPEVAWPTKALDEDHEEFVEVIPDGVQVIRLQDGWEVPGDGS